MLFRNIIGSLALLLVLAACNPDAPEVIELPTQVVLPSLPPPNTPIPTRPATSEPTVTSSATTVPTDTATPSATPVEWVSIVFVLRPIPAGYPIPPEAIILHHFPAESAPYSAVFSREDVINRVARVDIPCFEPVLDRMLLRREAGVGFLPLPESCGTIPALDMPLTFAEIVIAAQDIPAGTTITPDMVALRAFPVGWIPPDGIVTYVDALGKVAQVDILREQLLRNRHLGDG